MRKLLDSVRKLARGEQKKRVDARMREFEKAGRGKNVFNELCFCIMTANFTAERSMRIQDEVGCGFLDLPIKKLAGRLKLLGHRFPNTRACYIVDSRKHVKALPEVLASAHGDPREWLVKNVKGLGMKEASHFLRNIGFKDYAIIDFHIIDILAENKIIKRPKTLTKSRYLEIEGKLREIGCKLKMSLAELDLYLWYMETGKILK